MMSALIFWTPLQFKKSKPKTVPWLNDATLVRWAKSMYLSELIVKNVHRPRMLFSTINAVVNPPVSNYLSETVEMCEKKIKKIRQNIRPSTYDPAVFSNPSAIFSQFSSVSISVIHDIVNQLKPSGSPCDVISPCLFREVFDVVGPVFLVFINKCLESGIVPDCLKHATVKPLLKSPSLDPTVLSNFRPISNISFLSKIFQQMQRFLNDNKIFDIFQSGFRKFHSTETALIKVMVNDVLMVTDSRDSVVLVLFDLSAAFDTVDHEVLLARLEQVVGIRGTVLSWFQSYLKNRSFSINIGQYYYLGAVPLSCGVPQGSILAPLLFSLYMLPLASIFKKSMACTITAMRTILNFICP
ncbi:RNA-directed DNA polymerase from mobile element jockey [Labeo rohita]|uniref:RNA-directed DNA polymerase from mobile element jockey n=1 Tax=Labeo rohita TaxID=84645 RepID=A0ABQ8LCZ6_LABRO|nr:RNA-directed DNA polymerase from mobile element jockey [Labeo rohita]